jgi:hypothetical protein
MGREEHLLESNHLHEIHSDNIPFTAGRAAWEVPVRKFVRPNTDSAPKEEAREEEEEEAREEEEEEAREEEEEEEARKRRKQGKKSRAVVLIFDTRLHSGRVFRLNSHSDHTQRSSRICLSTDRRYDASHASVP